MSDEKRDKFDSMDSEPMDKFLDGLMTESEAKAFLANSEDSDLLSQQRELQGDIDQSLKRMFTFESLDAPAIEAYIAGKLSAGSQAHGESIEEPLVSLNSKPPSKSNWLRLAIAASLFLAAGMAIWQFNGSSDVQTAFFEPTPLAEVYSDSVQRGFRPYYLCNDPERFADTFESRHGQGLLLGTLPDGSRMLGISHLGGVSRLTTAMLCEVDGEKVLVFVDNLASDQRKIAMENDNPRLNVFVTTKRGLVFYEVSPLPTPRMTEHLEFLD